VGVSFACFPYLLTTLLFSDCAARGCLNCSSGICSKCKEGLTLNRKSKKCVKPCSPADPDFKTRPGCEGKPKGREGKKKRKGKYFSYLSWIRIIECLLGFDPSLVEQLWKWPYRQNVYFLIRSYISCNEPWRKNFSIWMKAIFLWVFKDLKILFSCGLPVPLITWLTCSELWRRFRNLWLGAWFISRVLPRQI